MSSYTFKICRTCLPLATHTDLQKNEMSYTSTPLRFRRVHKGNIIFTLYTHYAYPDGRVV